MGPAAHEASSRQPSCSLIRAPSITLARYSICGSSFGYYGALLFLISKPTFSNFEASEIAFALQLWFPPFVLYHPGEEAGLCSSLQAQKWELQVAPYSPPGWVGGPHGLGACYHLPVWASVGQAAHVGAEMAFISCSGTVFVFFCEI